MNTRLRLSLSMLALALPLVALAAPNSVSNITASLESDGIQVRWQKVDGDIITYRVFYSHASILNNGGLYDDFEEVAGTETGHLLRNVPPSSDVYVSVLAVNAAGEESPYFTEEAHVMLAMMPELQTSSSSATSSTVMQPTTSSTPPMPSSIMAPKEDILRLLSIDVVSATGVVLRFSHPVAVDPARATDALTITTASGTKLMMKRFVIQGTDILVDTAPQQRGTVYKVTVGTAVSAAGNAGQRLVISPDQAPVLFSGHPTGTIPTSNTSSASTSTATRTEILQLRLRAQPSGSTYRVEATWQPAGGLVSGYTIAQTTDGGKTFGAASTVKPEERDLIVSGVPAGTFGVRIRTVYTDGTMSQGITQTIQLPKIGGSTVTGSVTGGGSKALPNSGPALWLAIAATGAAAGFLQSRTKKTATQVV